MRKTKKRIITLDKLIEAAFEKNVLGDLTDEIFKKMVANYDKEQKDLLKDIAEAEEKLTTAEEDNANFRKFLSLILECTDLEKLTPELVNRLITKIAVFKSQKDENGKNHFTILIHFICVGVIQIPSSKAIIETRKEIYQNPPTSV